MSKKYTATLTLPVKYTNIPQDKLLQKEPIKNIDLIVKSSGFNILKSRFGNRTIAIKASNLKKKYSNKFYLLAKNQKNNIQKQLRSGIELQEIDVDTIFLEIGTLTSKKVPLKPNLEISYHIGYDILEAAKIKPDSLLISGPEAQIAAVKSINLELLKLEDVKANFSEKVKIILPKNAKNIRIASKYTTISGRVEKFTEGTITVPIKIKNLPKGVELTMLNKTVEVVFVVGLSNFNKIDKNFFEVICDYTISKENNLGYLVPKIDVKSNLIKSYKIIPNKIDFLIQK
ncbi:CdaR family protein [uncultured Polaribacter sp.]|uniref:CdaR family protein n=1 Tax=uncultured Polaribacter sp. TaxID=174711 RepID=UPI002616E4A8|nr:CdaR family protein [uncultured Polaribacter sp.]